MINKVQFFVKALPHKRYHLYIKDLNDNFIFICTHADFSALGLNIKNFDDMQEEQLREVCLNLDKKTYNDIEIGDTVYIWGIDQSYIGETTVTEKSDGGEYWKLKFSNKCTGYAAKNGTSSSMDMQICRVYSNKQALREAIDKYIKILNIIKG